MPVDEVETGLSSLKASFHKPVFAFSLNSITVGANESVLELLNEVLNVETISEELIEKIKNQIDKY